MSEKVSVLVLCQTPPPFVGQFMTFQKILNADFDTLELHHVDLSSSKTIDSIGKPSLFKFLNMFRVIGKTWYSKMKYQPQILYYPPASPKFTPIVRDLVILNCVRPFFKHTVFHFNASGVSEIYPSLPFWLRPLFRGAYFNATTAIRTSQFAVEDGIALSAKKNVVVSNGIKDDFSLELREAKTVGRIQLLYVGMLRETKGLFVLLQACAHLNQSGVEFELKLVGDFIDQETKQRAENYIKDNNLDQIVDFTGVLIGVHKWRVFANADVFCFPSFYEAESFGVVAVEAMSYQLPVVATAWRGLKGIVKDGETGFLVEIKNSNQLAEKLEQLIMSSDLRKKMGDAGRMRYLKKFTEKQFLKGVEKALVDTIID